MKSKTPKNPKKPKKSKKPKKIKIGLFEEVCFEVKKIEAAVLISICVVVFGVSSLVSGKLLYDFSQADMKNALGSQPETKIVESAVAAEKNGSGAEGDASLEESQAAEAAAAELALAKAQAEKAARAKMLARQRAAELARINNAPVLSGPTSKLPSGKRVCPLKHPRPSGRGGKPHVDEDCCADFDEYPNPRCEYSSSQMAALKK